MHQKDIAAYILAGGQSSRFEGQPKGMQLLDGKPLISHCIERLKQQTDCLHINSHLPIYKQFHLQLISDDEGKLYQGPLFGLLASMRHFRTTYSSSDKNWMLIAPCDCPFIPLNLIEKLQLKLSELYDKGLETQALSISYQKQLQPTFSLWHRDLYQEIKLAVEVKNWGGLKIFLNSLGKKATVIEYAEQQDDPFFNINTAAELEQAEFLINSRVNH